MASNLVVLTTGIRARYIYIVEILRPGEFIDIWLITSFGRYLHRMGIKLYRYPHWIEKDGESPPTP